LGNRSWRIRRVEMGKIRVEDAHGAPPTIPFWLGEAPARTAELSAAVAELREEVAAQLSGPHPGPLPLGGEGTHVHPSVPSVTAWLMAECGLDQAGAEQVVAYIAQTVAVLGAVPTQ